jgi:hypothetical protein
VKKRLKNADAVNRANKLEDVNRAKKVEDVNRAKKLEDVNPDDELPEKNVDEYSEGIAAVDTATKFPSASHVSPSQSTVMVEAQVKLMTPQMTQTSATTMQPTRCDVWAVREPDRWRARLRPKPLTSMARTAGARVNPEITPTALSAAGSPSDWLRTVIPQINKLKANNRVKPLVTDDAFAGAALLWLPTVTTAAPAPLLSILKAAGVGVTAGSC